MANTGRDYAAKAVGLMPTALVTALVAWGVWRLGWWWSVLAVPGVPVVVLLGIVLEDAARGQR